MAEGYNLIEVLAGLDPASTTYQEWVNVGMALKQEGYNASDWDAWSQRDPARYHPGDCFKKWDTFRGSTNAPPVAGGTIVQLAKDHGWQPDTIGHELAWDAVIGGSSSREDMVLIDKNWVEGQEVQEPGDDWQPAKQLITYLDTLFDSTDNVGYVTESWDKDGRHMPTKGHWDRTAGELIEALEKSKNDIGAVLGDYKPDVGAWIRFNPLDGNGVRNENVTDFRYALVESDETDLEKQNAIIRELELPVACLVHSGGKSLHAIVRVDAGSYEEYRKRVDYLYSVCQRNGLKVDSQNRNPSRLSRMPGVMRSEHKQFLVATNQGKANWTEWQEWIESITDDLPEPESMGDAWDNLPPLAPPLIDNVLRQGHKMLVAGPSKAGKSFLLIELCCAIAEGKPWLQWPCTQGRVLYVNLELDRASCLHRFKDVYASLGWKPNNVGNIDIWNLRGKSVPMDKLAPKLIRRATKKNYIAIVIDPIYKVITGDENSADQMAKFCNQFDLVCTELGAAVIYCHHHSKGSQGGKRSMDRASGSGVFARDPDVLLDLIELEVSDDLRAQEENKAVALECKKYLLAKGVDVDAELSQDDLCSAAAMQDAVERLLPEAKRNGLAPCLAAAKACAAFRTAWRVEGTLREFPKFPPVNLWFDYPAHRLDTMGSLQDIQPEKDALPYRRGGKKSKTPKDSKKERATAIENAFEICSFDDDVTLTKIAEQLGKSEDTARRHIKEHGGFWIEKGKVGKKQS